VPLCSVGAGDIRAVNYHEYVADKRADSRG
jgi:hypothetical protein